MGSAAAVSTTPHQQKRVRQAGEKGLVNGNQQRHPSHSCGVSWFGEELSEL